MDGGSFRAPRPLNTKAASRQEQAQQPEVPMSKPDPEPREPLARQAPVQPSSRRHFVLPAILITLIIAAIVAFLLWPKQSTATGIDSSKYQAVLLTNGESYLGKLSVLNEKFMKLTDIFYLKSQTSDNAANQDQQNTTDQTNVQLIKFGGEVQGPEDEMVIAKDQIVYYENLKTDGKATKAIKEYKNQ